MRKSLLVIGLAICISLLAGSAAAYATAPYQPITYYVNDDATGANTGTTWEDAFTDLQSALSVVVAGDQIWVAAGTYKPSLSIDGSADARTAAFSLKSGVAVFGGFAGDEKRLKERNLDTALTVLSGDIGTAGDDADNSYHVVYASGVTGAVLDGFTVTSGRGNLQSYYGRDIQGAGMYNVNSSFTVSNCVFSDNRVIGRPTSVAAGAGMYNENSALTVTDCTFNYNQAGIAYLDAWGRGGGMFNRGYYNEGVYGSQTSNIITGCTFTGNFAAAKYIEVAGGTNGGGGMNNEGCDATVDRCTFAGNSAGNGGAILNFICMPTITNCIFTGNYTTYGDGGGGAILNLANATILNCTFYKNGWRAHFNPPYDLRPYTRCGGAIYDYRVGSTITNCIFSENAVSASGGAIKSWALRPPGTTLTNCLFYKNIHRWLGWTQEEIDHVDIDGYYEESGNLYDVDPLLVDPAGGDFRLPYCSPCVDAGYDFTRGYWSDPVLPATDFYGDKRLVDGDGDGTRAVDIGIDEYVPDLPGLRAFLEALAVAGGIDETLAARLLAYVDAAEAALAEDDEAAAVGILNELIADVEASLGDTETAQLIERKTRAVIEEI
ncbi:MAG: right-handed parallel beta-helix repeat-containing protein [Thermoleophilia bacterium]|nr:right-handed parallel beta-helix repeat-containing protein [Thermoleophilia bacterium]